MLNQALIGHRYPDSPPYELGREKIREFAEAVGATHPAHFDRTAAHWSGYRDVVAPPTFAVVVTQPASRRATEDPALGLDLSRVVHGEQRFVYVEPICAGDVVTASVLVRDIRQRGPHWMLVTETDLLAVADRRLLCTSIATLVMRGEVE